MRDQKRQKNYLKVHRITRLNMVSSTETARDSTQTRSPFGETDFFVFKVLRIRIGSGLDPDSTGSLVPDSQSGSGSEMAKMTHKNIKQLK
jgi:hypothetical protein